jgi:hypothetical protein
MNDAAMAAGAGLGLVLVATGLLGLVLYLVMHGRGRDG